MRLSELLKDIKWQLEHNGDGEVYLRDEVGDRRRPYLRVEGWKTISETFNEETQDIEEVQEPEYRLD